ASPTRSSPAGASASPASPPASIQARRSSPGPGRSAKGSSPQDSPTAAAGQVAEEGDGIKGRPRVGSGAVSRGGRRASSRWPVLRSMRGREKRRRRAVAPSPAPPWCELAGGNVRHFQDPGLLAGQRQRAGTGPRQVLRRRAGTTDGARRLMAAGGNQ